MRILTLNYEYPPLGGGASPVTRGLCMELARRHQIDVVTMAFRGLAEREQIGNLTVHRTSCLRRARHQCDLHEMLTWLPGATTFGLRLLCEQRYDLIHGHFFFPTGVVARRLSQKTGVPYVITAHGSDVPGYNPDRFRASHRVLAPLWRQIVQGASAVTSPSQWLADLIRSNLREPMPIHIVPNGIEEDWVVPRQKEPRILLVSRLFERKGVQVLLKALRGHRFGYVVDIVGDGPYREELEAMARHAEDPVTFHGWLEPSSPELKNLYATASIFVFPSLAENFPICLLEAMSSGAAIIASDLPACREVLGGAALYAAPGDTAALRHQLQRLKCDPAARSRIGAEARERVLDHFVWPRIAEQYEEIFSTITKPGDVPVPS